MSEEVSVAMADIAYWHRRAETAESSRDQWREKAHTALDQLRAARDELQAARAVVAAAQARRHELPGGVYAALVDYDAATKARDG